MINILVDLTGKSPTLANASESVQKQAIYALLQPFDLTTAQIDPIYDYVVKNFAQLFDFPLKMPKFELLTLRGVVRINAPPTIQLTFNDFLFYHLTAEYTTGSDPEALQPHVSRFEWDKDKFSNSMIKFAFTEPQVQNRIHGLVTVKLAAFDNATMYTQDFRPSDPGLQNLDLSVGLRLPSTISSTSDGPTQGITAKIRGKIVSMSTATALAGTIIKQRSRMTILG